MTNNLQVQDDGGATGAWVIEQDRCTQCGRCVRACPEAVIALDGVRLVLAHPEACTYCGLCEDLCPVGAIALAYAIVWDDDSSHSSLSPASGSHHRRDAS